MSGKNKTENFHSFEEAATHASRKPDPAPRWKALLNAFAFFYIFTVTVWALPDSSLKDSFLKYTEKPMQALGWYQHWSVFAPNLREINYHETAIITFKDGSTKIYEYPRMNKMSLWEKFRREKLRKMFSDCLPWPGYNILLPVFARHLAQANDNSENPPTSISYVFNWVKYGDPKEDTFVSRSRLPKHTNKEITFVYRVKESDLDI